MSEAVAYFNDRAAHYNDAANKVWAWQRGREARAVFSLIGDVHGCTAADFGCGTGFYARRLVAAGASRVVGVDVAPAMIEEARASGLEIVEGNIAALDLAMRFDLIVIAGALEFTDRPGDVIASAHRHLVPGGRLVILYPPDNLAGRGYRWFHHRHGVRIELFTSRQIRQMAQDAGFTVKAQRKVLPYTEVMSLIAS